MVRVSMLLLAFSCSLLLSRADQGIEAGPAVNSILSSQVYGFTVVFAVHAVERAGLHRSNGEWWYAIAVFIGVGVGTALYWFLSQRLVGIPTDHIGAAGFESYASFVLRHGPLSLTALGLATAVYVSRSRATLRLETLREVQSRRAHAEQELAEARLAALKARIDPDYVLAELERLEWTYDCDPAEAERRLEALVLYLRASIPASSAAR